MPPSRVPENTLKYGVGVMLAAFGAYWSLEGVGYFRDGGESLDWPGGKLALILLVGAWFALTQAMIAGLRRSRTTALTSTEAAA